MSRARTAAILALCAWLASDCGGRRQEERKVRLRAKVPTLAMDCVSNGEIKQAADFIRLAAKKFCATEEGRNVEIAVDIFDYVDEHKAVPESYDTDGAVDVLYEGYFNMEAYIHSGRVVPLDDIITDEIRADIPESTWKQGTKDGRTYMMPFLSLQNILAYNKQLFRDCGLERYVSDRPVIQNWTIGEWEEILDALAARLPTGFYPMMMYAANNQGDTHIMSLVRAFGSRIFDESGGFDFESPEAVRALRWIQDGVARGWYAKHCENLEIIDNNLLYREGRMGVYMFNNQSFSIFGSAERCMELNGFVNFPNKVATSFVTGFEVFDNGDEERVRAAKAFVKFIYEDEELMDLSAGGIPESRRVAEKYKDALPMLEEFSRNAANVVDFINSSPNWQGRSDSVRSVFYPHIRDLLAGHSTPEQCAAALNRDCNAAIRVEAEYHE